MLAHRGLALEAPENTLLAFLHAVNLGATHVETDVHGSADGVAMISHDPDLSRLVGRDVRVGQLTAAELRRVQLGAGQGYCSLADALDAFPETRFNIDVKSADAVEGTIAAIRDARATERVLVGSFSDRRRLAVVGQLPGVATSVSARGALAAAASIRLHSGAAVSRVLRGVDAVQLPTRVAGVSMVSARAVEYFHAAGVEVHIWTIDDPDEMVRLLDAGVDGIVTDRADLAIPLVAERRRTRR
ncbi:glycerophosphodiester phosphodiesterase family protein [Protaetiibacter mangrovi]|uniref:Glycerophosphodiester phosphodiesterase n=1 Tax=Protaetiibacter mangrovi TaxID=2970926 RepID=A0ABT1ZC86_9MICO|nr:glycerophosphodiester phosphodiesterase family protein [Protaetiibacter mangrovi]MCS0498313.1 glycerophosphodiester phosphodiesterase [Protaetiibacter mangrovi]TPX05356.1 glycerophosphodiester phosphodiesterase [Schumannella luteola]